MKRSRLALTVLTVALFARLPAARAHCEVPCGIYADQLRFEKLLEDQTTIAKAIASLKDLAGKADPQAFNQATRWVATKEQHATEIQHTIAQYFMTQRIKPGTDEAGQQAYVKKLTAAHAILIAAMKTKQTADEASAETLRKAILDFYRAYEGKEPDGHDKK